MERRENRGDREWTKSAKKKSVRREREGGRDKKFRYICLTWTAGI